MMKKLKEMIVDNWQDNVISFFLAILIWAGISVYIDPNLERRFVDIPVEVNMDGTYAQSINLDISKQSTDTVTLVISGERAELKNITEEDLHVYADTKGVMLAKGYELPVNVESRSGKEFTIESLTPSTINVTFDKIITKELPVEADIQNLRLQSTPDEDYNYITGDVKVVPDTVTVTGPETILNSVTRTVAKVDYSETLSESHEFTADHLLLYNENSLVLDTNKQVAFNRGSFSVSVPVYVHRRVPLDVNIVNAPEGFDLDYFTGMLGFSADSLDIAAPDDSIKMMEKLTIGTINMRAVDVGSVFEFSTENFLPEGYLDLSNLDTITVTCPTEGISRKPIVVKGKDIQFINKPRDFEFESISSGITIYLVGDTKQIDEINSSHVLANVDLINFDMQEGEHRMTVDFIIDPYKRVWFNAEDEKARRIYVSVVRSSENEPSADIMPSE